ncbi:MAG: hypothetical protein R3F61_14135 [Myxococcota bacterium]
MIWMLAGLAFAQDDPAPEPEPAAAESDMAEAKKLYENGVRLYDEALYDEAIAAFQASYDLSKQHALLFNIANAYERKGDLANAIKTLNQYRIYASEDEQSKLDRRVRTLEERLDKEKAADKPAPTPTPVPEGPRTKTVGNPAKWVSLGTGLGTTVVFGTLAGVTYAQGQSAIDAGDETAYTGPRALNNVSIGLAVAGLGLTTVGLALPAKREVPVAVGLSVTPTDAHVRASWRF